MNTEHGIILLVEDNPRDVLLMKRAFHKANLTISLQVVEDGEAAVRYLSGVEPYSDRLRYPLPVLVLLDLKLPRKSGAEVLAWVRKQPELKRLPIVILTSSKEYVDVNNVYDLGGNAYMVKPIAFDNLVDIVKTINMHWIIFNEKPELGRI